MSVKTLLQYQVHFRDEGPSLLIVATVIRTEAPLLSFYDENEPDLKKSLIHKVHQDCIRDIAVSLYEAPTE